MNNKMLDKQVCEFSIFLFMIWLIILYINVRISVRGGTQARPCKDIIIHQDNIIFFYMNLLSRSLRTHIFR
mgnify:CR=1 FL=1